jgi:hypothetical protein
MQTKIIAAYPCLGKTTLSKISKKRFLDMEFNESSKTKMMNEIERSYFFDFCVQKIEEEYYSGNFEIIFISEDDEILRRLLSKKISFILILPNALNKRVMQDYKSRVVYRSGENWWNDVIEPEICSLQKRIEFYKNNELVEVYLTNENEYICDKVDLW